MFLQILYWSKVNALQKENVMKKCIKVIASMLAALSCASLASCGGDKKKTVTIGYTDYEPMNYTDANGKLVGFDTELAEKVFGELGYKVRFKLIEWSNKYAEVDSGTIDCIWNGFTANCADDDGIQRSAKVDFSYYYMTNAQCVIRLNTSPELVSASEFDGKSVAYEGGSAADSYMADVIEKNSTINVNTKEVTAQMDAVLEVNAGTAQYAVIDLLLANSIAGKGDFTNIAINESIVIEAEYYAIGFKKGSELTAKVNEKLLAYAKDGSLKALADKYKLSNQVILNYDDQK